MQNLNETNESNLLWAVGFILAISCGCALYSAYVVQVTLDSLGNSNMMALIIIDGGKSFASDDASLERNLNSATAALRMTADVAYATVAACLIMFAGLAIRLVKRL
jgi:hypothetical protein